MSPRRQLVRWQTSAGEFIESKYQCFLNMTQPVGAHLCCASNPFMRTTVKSQWSRKESCTVITQTTNWKLIICGMWLTFTKRCDSSHIRTQLPAAKQTSQTDFHSFTFFKEKPGFSLPRLTVHLLIFMQVWLWNPIPFYTHTVSLL